MHNLHLDQRVPPEKDGHRLDQVLSYLFPQYSRALLQKQIQNGSIQLDSRPITKKNTLVFQNQTIQLNLILKHSEPSWEGDASLSLTIIHEDEALLVVDKPAGMVTHPAPGHTQATLVNALLHHVPALSQLPRSGIIHRLDKDTSGLLVIPKTHSAHTYLIKEMAQRNITRLYHTIVKGHFTVGGTINAPIGRHPVMRQKQAVTLKGNPAITHYSILERFKHHTLLKVKLETGRTHQIRVHMAHINHPILGDPLYGRCPKHAPLAFKRQALHAKTLGFKHPLTGENCLFESPLPDDIQSLLVTLRTQTASD